MWIKTQNRRAIINADNYDGFSVGEDIENFTVMARKDCVAFQGSYGLMGAVRKIGTYKSSSKAFVVVAEIYEKIAADEKTYELPTDEDCGV